MSERASPTQSLDAPATVADRSRQLAEVVAALQEEIAERRRVEQALHTSEARYRAVVESQTELICRYLPDTTLTFVNEAYCRYFGLTREQLIGRRFLDLIPEPARGAAAAHVASLLANPRVVTYEHESLLADGSLGWQEWTDHVVVDAYGQPVEVQGIGRDVTERRRAEERVRTLQALLQSTMDALAAHVAILDESGTIVAVNEPWRHFARGYRFGGATLAVGTNYLHACDTAAQAGDRTAVEAAAGVRAVLAGRQLDFWMLYACPTETRPAWYRLHVTRFSQQHTRRLVVVRADVTELLQAQQQLRELSGRLLRSQDDERRRIARELHDGTAQNIAAITMNLQRLQALAQPRSPDELQLLWESSQLAEASLDELRTLSHLLHPPLLDEMGLVSALRWYVEGFSRRSGIPVDLDVDDTSGRLPMDVETALFRILQESLTNIHRHSGSATARVQLAQRPRQVVLRVQDRGRGILPPAPAENGAAPPVGVGIPGMRQRLHQLGGRLELRSTRRGTTVIATVPARPVAR